MLSPINAPVIAPAEHTLVASVGQTSDESRWEGGVTFLPSGCAKPRVAVISCPPATLSAVANACSTPVEAAPYLLEVGFTRPMGSFGESQLEELATLSLTTGATAALTAGLINGVADTEAGHLGLTTGLVTATDGPLPAPVALGLMQEIFAEWGAHGTVYTSPLVANLLPNLTETDDGKLRTVNRYDMVIVDNVAAFAPNTEAGEVVEADAGSRWIYGHLGEPEVRIGSLEVHVVPIRDTNTWEVRGTAHAVVTFDPCIRVAAEVSAFTPPA